ELSIFDKPDMPSSDDCDHVEVAFDTYLMKGDEVYYHVQWRCYWSEKTEWKRRYEIVYGEPVPTLDAKLDPARAKIRATRFPPALAYDKQFVGGWKTKEEALESDKKKRAASQLKFDNPLSEEVRAAWKKRLQE